MLGTTSPALRRLAAGAGVGMLALLVACAPAAAPSPTTAPAQPAGAQPAAGQPAQSQAPAAKPLSRTNATVAAVSNSWTVMLVPLVALEKGFWKEAGLTEAEVKVVGPAATHVAAAIGGSIDFSINLNTEGTARANANGDPLFGIAGSTNKPNYALWGKGVQTVADLKGKAIAIDSPGGVAETISTEIIEAKGLDRTEVTFVPVAGTIEERTRAMLTGATAAALGSISDWPTLRPQGVVNLGTLAEVHPDFQFALTVARGEMLEKYPDTTVAFLKGMIRAFQFVQDPKNDEEIAQILKKHDIRVDDANWKELLEIQRPLMTPDGSVNLKGTEVVLKRLADTGGIPATYKADQLLRLDLLKQAQQELGIKVS